MRVVAEGSAGVDGSGSHVFEVYHGVIDPIQSAGSDDCFIHLG